MSKTLNGGAQIPYGPSLPTTLDIPDGLAFYKTNNADNGGTSGIYVYGYTGGFGAGSPQLTQGWLQIAGSPDLFVKKTGDVMTGQLEIPSFLRITQTGGPQRIVMGNQNSLGANKPAIIQAANGAFRIGFGDSWSGDGGNMVNYLSVDPSDLTNGLAFLGQKVWHAGNDGVGSGLDADLLDGQDSAYYLNVANMTAGILPVARGGTGNNATVVGGIAYGASSTALNFSAAGTVNQVLLSGGAGAPTWAAQSSLSVGFATSANTANSANTATNSSQLGGVTEDRVIMKRRRAIQTSDGTSLNSSITKLETGFSYGGSGEPFGPFITFGGLDTSSDYVAQMGGAYNGGNDFKIRTRNGDNTGSWNPWRTFLTDGNYNTYAPTLTGGGASGTWAINITGAAAAVPWTGVTGRPTLYYQFNAGTASPGPNTFPSYSIAGFDALSMTDFPAPYHVGIQAIGPAGTRSMQITANWNAEEGPPSGLYFRVNDDTSDINSWSQWTGIWNTANLTNLSQLANGPGYATTAQLGSYVAKGGDTMTGALTVGTAGRMVIQPGNGSNTGYAEFVAANGVRSGYIGFGSGATGMNYVVENGASNHAFTGNISATGNVTAYASDMRLKTNVQVIENAMEKIGSLGGYSYDWKLNTCSELGFAPVYEHEHGLLAQEVEKVMPDAVAPAPFNEEYLTVRYERLVALLVAGMNELKAEIEELKAAR